MKTFHTHELRFFYQQDDHHYRDVNAHDAAAYDDEIHHNDDGRAGEGVAAVRRSRDAEGDEDRGLLMYELTALTQ